MRIVTWNMNYWPRSAENRAGAWQYLREELQADVALVQEALPPPDSNAVFRPIEKCNWGSAVVALSPKYTLRPRTRRAPVSDPSAGELIECQPGASAVADVVDVASGLPRIVAVSFYGAWEYLPKDPEKPNKRQAIYSVATSHRTLSDLTPLLVWSRKMPHKIPVLLAGDFNATTQIATDNYWDVEISEAATLFDRMRALGLRDLIAVTRESRPRLPGCSCPSPDICCHVRTYRHANRAEGRPTQLDYVYGSEQVLQQLSECTVLDEAAAWALSDHCPIVIDLRDAD